MLRNIVFTSILVLLQNLMMAQQKEHVGQSLKFKNISLEHGLSQSSILCILQDDLGFLWFGTRDGLNKFDGHTFKTYRHNAQDTTSLSNSYIRSLYQDTHGTLWVGTSNGLNKYIPEKDGFKRFLHEESGITYNDEIRDIIADDEEHLWIASNFGLGRLDIKSEFYDYYICDQTDSTSLSNLVRAIEKTSNGSIWVKTVEGIDSYDNKTNSFKHYNFSNNTFETENINFKSTIYEDKKGNLWLGLEEGLSIYDNSQDAFKGFKLKGKSIQAITDPVRSIIEDNLGKLWVGTYNGLYVIDAEKQKISHFLHDENNPNSLAQNSIYSIYQDRKGDIWIGTYAGGISYYDRSYDLFKHVSSGANNSKLSYKVVSAIVQDSDDNLWIGTEGGGINFYNKDEGAFTYYTHQTNNNNSISANNVKALIQDHNGNFWIGTHNEGLNFLNPKSKPYCFKTYRNNPGNENSLSDDTIISLFEDENHNIWIGTSGGGINMLNSSTQTFVRIKDPNEAVGSIVYSISKSTEQDMLLIGGDKGLAKLNTKSLQLISIPFREQSKNKTASNSVLCTFEDNENNIWIGTEGDGLFCYNESNHKSINYGISQGLPNGVIYSIEPDDANNLWMSTNNGLSRMDLKKRTFKNFDVSDGLQGNEFNYGASLKNKYGELLFGGTNGFNVFNPARISANEYIPPVSITSLNVNNRPFNLADKHPIKLNYDQNVLNFDFVALSYTQPNKNQYAYKLEGFDENWNYVGNKKSATYTNLDSGNYIFKVKASNNDGLWNEIGDSINITIRSAPWYTWWAFLLYTMAIVSILYYINVLVIARVKAKNELEQEKRDKKRIEEINKLKLKLFTNISHDFRTPLTLIVAPLQRLIDKQVGDAFLQNQLRGMYRNATTLLQLINQLLDFRKSEAGKIQLKYSKKDIIPFLEDVKLSFEELAIQRQIGYDFKTSSANIDVWFDSIELKKVIVNLLANAFKFTPKNGAITIHVSTVKKTINDISKEESLEIKIRDTGKGIPEKEIVHIFDRFFQLSDRNKKRYGTGVGLSLAKEIVELHHGNICVKNNKNKGVTFTVMLPLGRVHLSDDEIIIEDEYIENIEGINSNESIIPIPKYEEEDIQKVNFDESLPSILLVEDNIEIRKFIKDIFDKNFNVFEAKHGKKGVEIAQKNTIDLIISDVMMPKMDGVEMTHILKSNIKTSHIPIILLTAKTSSKAQKKGYKTGADIYITKPFDAKILKLQVDNLFMLRKRMILKYKKDILLTPKELTVTSADEQFLEKAFKTVENCMTDPSFNANAFTENMGVSRTLLYNKIKALTGQSLSQFIRTARIKRVAQMLVKTDMNISEIAYELGFNDLKYFRNSFKTVFNMTPKEYRAKNKNAVPN